MLEIHLDDRFVDLVEEGFDLAIRITRLESSSLIARRLAPFSRAGLRLAGADRQARQRRHGRRTSPTCPASSTPMAAGCPTGRSSATMARSISVSVVRADRGEQPAGGARRRRLRAWLRHPAGFHRRAGRSRPAGSSRCSTTACRRAAASSPSIRTAAICRPRCASSSTSWCSGSRSCDERYDRRCWPRHGLPVPISPGFVVASRRHPKTPDMHPQCEHPTRTAMLASRRPSLCLDRPGQRPSARLRRSAARRDGQPRRRR